MRLEIYIKKQDALDYFGDGMVTKAAKILGREHTSVCRWGEYVPEALAWKMIWMCEHLPGFKKRGMIPHIIERDLD